MEKIKFSQTPKKERAISSEKRIEAYANVSGDKTFPERAKIGQMSVVREIGENYVEKRDKSGDLPLAVREFLILNYLQDTKIVPQVGEIIINQDGTARFTMEKINNGATLQEWLMGYMTQQIPEDIIQEILEETCEAIGKMWQKGVVHADLHLNNVIVGMEKGGTKMKPTIIDFGVSKMSEKKFRKMEEELEIERDPQSIQQFKDGVSSDRQEMTYSEEFNFFRDYVESIVGTSSPVLETLDQLALAADILDNPVKNKKNKKS
jgi:tRNA A-37 threonylcarbamoyl transferase component Bud32